MQTTPKMQETTWPSLVEGRGCNRVSSFGNIKFFDHVKFLDQENRGVY